MTHTLGGVGNLALQVGEVHHIVIGHRDLTDAGCCQIHGNRRAQSTRTDDQRMAVEQPLLAFNAKLI